MPLFKQRKVPKDETRKLVEQRMVLVSIILLIGQEILSPVASKYTIHFRRLLASTFFRSYNIASLDIDCRFSLKQAKFHSSFTCFFRPEIHQNQHSISVDAESQR